TSSPRTSCAGSRDVRWTTSSTRRWATSPPRGAEMNPTEMTAVELVAAYGAKELSPVEVTNAIVDRIEEVDGEINAFCLVDRESALVQARESEARWQAGTPKGLLDGVPTSMKDIFLTKGW